MQMIEPEILKVIRFADLNQWSADFFRLKKMNFFYPLKPLSHVLNRIKEPVIIEDEKRYKRITVRLYGQGALKRDELYGKEIGTKRQFIARKGQIIISRIDARNGAVAIVSDELDGAVVTNDFWLFDVQNALPQYLILVLSSECFQQYWKTQSSETTNRQRVNENSFLMAKIALPEINVQKGLLYKYNEAVWEAQQKESNIAKIDMDNEEYIMDQLRIYYIKELGNKDILRVVSYKSLAGKWEWDKFSEVIEKSLKYCIYPIKSLGEVVSFANRTWQRKKCFTDTFMYIEIGGINAIDNTVTANEILVTDAPSRATQIVKKGDLIIGTTRPYLKRYALIRDCEDGYVCSSAFQVIEESRDYDLRFIMEMLKLEPVIKQFEALMTGALYPAVNIEQLKQIRIPIPSVEIQKSIADYIDQKKETRKALYQQAEALRRYAKEQFEEVVFGEA